MFTIPSAERAPREPGVRKWQGPAIIPGDGRAILARADRACCCPARPGVIAWIPPSRTRPHWTDLLLCHHHERAAMAGLLAVGAVIVNPGERPSPARDRHPARSG